MANVILMPLERTYLMFYIPFMRCINCTIRTVVKTMVYDSRYTKANVTPEAARVLRIVAAERGQYIYALVDEILREKFPNYFRGC